LLKELGQVVMQPALHNVVDAVEAQVRMQPAGEAFGLARDIVANLCEVMDDLSQAGRQ
jgi:hypothetical protein